MLKDWCKTESFYVKYSKKNSKHLDSFIGILSKMKGDLPSKKIKDFLDSSTTKEELFTNIKKIFLNLKIDDNLLINSIENFSTSLFDMNRNGENHIKFKNSIQKDIVVTFQDI